MRSSVGTMPRGTRNARSVTTKLNMEGAEHLVPDGGGFGKELPSRQVA
jgi:hypothetical protein